jgi:hypothetical protein
VGAGAGVRDEAVLQQRVEAMDAYKREQLAAMA